MKSTFCGSVESAFEDKIGVSSKKISFFAAFLYAVVPLVLPSLEGLEKPSISPSEIRSSKVAVSYTHLRAHET